MPAPWATREDVEAFLTGGDYETLIPTAASPDTAMDRALNRAWEVIEDHTDGTWELVEGVPTWTDPDDDEITEDVTTALVSAVCAQIEQWCEVGEENDIAGFPGETFMSTGISVNRLPSVLAPRAARFLRRASILGTGPADEAAINVILV